MNELPKVERTTLTMKETAEYLGVSYWLVNQLVRRKQIPCARVGGRVLFRVKALDEYLSAKEEKSFSQISGLFEKNSKYEKENKEFYDDLKEQLSSKDGYKADQITTDNYEGKYVISGVTGVVRGTLSYDYKVTYQKEDVTVGNMNGTVDGSSQMSAEFVYKDGNYQLRTVNPGSIWYRESQ